MCDFKLLRSPLGYIFALANASEASLDIGIEVGQLCMFLGYFSSNNPMELVTTVEEATVPPKESKVETYSSKKRRRRSYLDMEKVSDLFPDANVALVCKLCEMREVSPSKVYSLVPSASLQQMSRFLKLYEVSIGTDSAGSGEIRKTDSKLICSQEKKSQLAELNRAE